MSQKAARGTKRTCPACNSRFYDLNNDPATCPICQAVYHQEVTPESAAPVLAVDPKVVKAAKLPPKEKELLVAEAPEGGELPEMESTEALAEIEAEDTEVAGEEEDTFLEVEEGEESDVAGFIDGAPEGEEEA